MSNTSSMQTVPPLFTRNFWLLSLACLGFFSSLHLLTPSFPLFLEAKVSLPAWAIGALLSSFTVTSMILRPLVGKWCDEGSCRRFMVAGAVVSVIIPLLYSVCHQPVALFLLRIVHGIGMSLFYTASNALLSREVPVARRAEGMSHYSNAIKVAMGFAPALGLFFATQQQFVPIFLCSAGAALMTLLCVLGIQEPEQARAALSSRGKWINTHALLPGGVMATNSIVFGTLIPFVPFFFAEKGFLHQASWFYTVYAFFLIFSRAFTGRLSDQVGRAKVILPGMLGVSLALILMALAANVWVFLASTAFYGLCAGTVQPSLMALSADRTASHERGSAMATFTLLNDSGLALGTFLTGALGPVIGYTQTLWIIIAITVAGSAYFALWQAQERKNSFTNREMTSC